MGCDLATEQPPHGYSRKGNRLGGGICPTSQSHVMAQPGFSPRSPDSKPLSPPPALSCLPLSSPRGPFISYSDPKAIPDPGPRINSLSTSGLISPTVSSAQCFIKISDGKVKVVINQCNQHPVPCRQGWAWTQITSGGCSPSPGLSVWPRSGQELVSNSAQRHRPQCPPEPLPRPDLGGGRPRPEV